MHLLVPGDGIEPELTAAALAVHRAVSERFALRLRSEEALVGRAGLRAHGGTIHTDIVEKARLASHFSRSPCSERWQLFASPSGTRLDYFGEVALIRDTIIEGVATVFGSAALI